MVILKEISEQNYLYTLLHEYWFNTCVMTLKTQITPKPLFN